MAPTVSSRLGTAKAGGQAWASDPAQFITNIQAQSETNVNALGDCRYWIIDLDHVVWQAGGLIDGVAEALATLRRTGCVIRFLTNDSQSGVAGRATSLRGAGLIVEDHEMLTASILAGRYLQSAELRRPFVLASEEATLDVRRSVEPVTNDADCIVIGDIFSSYNEDLVRQACALLLRGLPLIAMQRNRCCGAPEFGVVDVGFWVAAFETVSKDSAILVGKPSPFAFTSAVESLPGATFRNTVMVGDSLDIDLAQAGNLGLATIHISSSCEEPPRWLSSRFASLADAVDSLIH